MDPLGITPFQKYLIDLCKGFSYPPSYGELGIMVNSLLKKKKLPEDQFRVRFLSACQKGLIAPLNEAQFHVAFRSRKYKLTKRGEEALRAFHIATGGDYSYYRYYDGNPKSLDRFLGTRYKGIKVSDTERRRADIFAEHNRNPNALRLGL